MPRESVGVLLAVFALSACGHKSSLLEPAPSRPTVPDAEATALHQAPIPSASSSSTPIDAGKPRAPKAQKAGPTAEAVLAEAKAAVEEAVRHASAKDVCAEVLPLLDVSYLIAHGVTSVDENALGTFATCAVEHQRWALLRELAQAIAAGERKKEATYFLPRALLGLGNYDTANTLSKATLRAWPTEGEAYTTAALAAFRVKDWDGSIKATDQALLLLHKQQHGPPTKTTLLAHGLRGAALLRMGKTDEGVHEVELTKTDDSVLRVTDVTLEGVRAAKQYALLTTVDASDEAYPALWPLYAKKVAPFSGLVTVVLQNLADKPTAVVVEVSIDGGSPAAESETVQKGHPITLELTPELPAISPLFALKTGEAHDIVVTVSGGLAKTQLFRETRKVTFEPADALPKVVRSHGDDLRSAFGLEAAWVTPAAPAIVALVESAKTRLKAGTKTFAGAGARSLPQAQALWDELRSRGVSFHRDPRIDTETQESTPCGLPTEILEAAGGNALESSVLFASLLEAIGLDVVLVRTPGHRMVGWLATPPDLAASDTAASTVKSPLGQAFFVETTTVGEGPFDAAVLRGAATWVAATNDGSLTSGRAELESVKELRKRGVVPRER